jgi:hypothetical protein
LGNGRFITISTVPKVAEDLRKRKDALHGVSFSWFLDRIDLGLLEQMEGLAERGDRALLELLNEMNALLRDSDVPIDGSRT